MTGDEFSRVDFDLLADYVGGALQGTPEESTVAGLVAADPHWRAAQDELTAALAYVDVELRAIAAVAEPMPEDVVARLDAALAAAPAVGTQQLPAADQLLADGSPETGEAPGRPHLSAVPDATGADGRLSAHGSAARRTGGARSRRWQPKAGAFAAAAAVVAFAGFGVSYLARPDSGSDGVASTSAREGFNGPAAAGGYANREPAAGPGQADQKGTGDTSAWAAVPAPRVVASGTRYALTTVAQQIPTTPMASTDIEASGTPAVQPLSSRQVTPALQRLNNANTLRACLDAIQAAHGSAVAAVELVDYAVFEGLPALVVVFTEADAARWVWVSGPACGEGGSGADVRFRTQVR